MALITVHRHITVIESTPDSGAPVRRPRRRALAFATILLTCIGLTAAVTAATANPAGTDTTSVDFVSLPAPYKILAAKAMTANTVVSAVVSGGATKVPTSATTVEFNVTTTAKVSGSLAIFPAGNTGGASAAPMAYFGGETATTSINENIGLANEVSFKASTAVTLTVTILGYSTQVTAGDINSSSGTAGQVLTNNGFGSGVTWQTPAKPSASNFDPTGGTAGQVLTNTGTGAQWATSGQIYSGVQHYVIPLAQGTNTVDSVTLPAGTYYLSGDADFHNYGSSPSGVSCDFVNPNGTLSLFSTTNLPTTFDNSLHVSAIVSTNSGGTYTFECDSATADNWVIQDEVVAIQESQGHGFVDQSSRTNSTRTLQKSVSHDPATPPVTSR